MQLVKDFVLNNATLESRILCIWPTRSLLSFWFGWCSHEKIFSDPCCTSDAPGCCAAHVPTIQDVVSRRTCLLAWKIWIGYCIAHLEGPRVRRSNRPPFCVHDCNVLWMGLLWPPPHSEPNAACLPIPVFVLQPAARCSLVFVQLAFPQAPTVSKWKTDDLSIGLVEE